MSIVTFPITSMLAIDRARGLRPPAHWYMPDVEFLPAADPVLRADACHVKGVLAVSRAYLAQPAPSAAPVPPSRWRVALRIVGWSVGAGLAAVGFIAVCMAFGASLQLATR